MICSIENLDPSACAYGDSITVAPAQTLTDKEYQLMRDAALKIIREIGVDTGGSIPVRDNPATGRMTIIEMNPRVSRSSALASKATGFPIVRSRPSWLSFSLEDRCQRSSPMNAPVQTDNRLRGHQNSALRLRKIYPARADELGANESVGEVMEIGTPPVKSSRKRCARSNWDPSALKAASPD